MVQKLFFLLMFRPLVLLVLGLNIRNRERLPSGEGPAIVVANHNSHLDTFVLMSLFKIRHLPRVRPVAAADYFLKNPLMRWFALNIMNIVPVVRQAGEFKRDPLAGATQILQDNGIVILFPEGTRGRAEELSTFRNGVGLLAERFPQVPVVPIFLHGLGKVLPKGEGTFVPFFCDVFVGEARLYHDDRKTFVKQLSTDIEAMARDSGRPVWD